MYSKKVIEYFKNPKNMGRIKDADGVGVAGNPVCGDVLKFYIKVKDGIIVDVKWETLGCVAAIAASSALSEMIKEKTIEEAKKITTKEIANELGGLPPIKMHCSYLAENALKKAIENYLKNERKN